MKQARADQVSLNIRRSLRNLRSSIHQFNFLSGTITLEQEVENSVIAFLVNRGLIPRASVRDELKEVLFHNLRFNREAKKKLSEEIDWTQVNFDIATSAQDCLAAYGLVFARYQPLGFNDLTLIDDSAKDSSNNHPTIPGLTYDENDKRSITVVIKGSNQLNGTLRLISGDTHLLPTEILFDKHKGLEHIRKQQDGKGKTISEISKLALNENANPMVHYRTLLVSKSLIAKPLNIGNEISIVPKSEYDRGYKRIGFIAERTQRFYRQLEEPDVICSWDQDTQLSAYYQSIVVKEMRKSISELPREKAIPTPLNRLLNFDHRP